MMTRDKDGKVKRVKYDQTLTLDSTTREVAMRTQFVKAGRYLVKKGDNLNGLLKEIYR